MKIIDFRSVAKFAAEKMQRHAVLESEQMSSELYCFEPGQAQRSQKFDDSDRMYFVLEGTGRFSIGRTTREVGVGKALLAPAGEEHGVINMTEERLLLLVMTSPPSVA